MVSAGQGVHLSMNTDNKAACNFTHDVWDCYEATCAGGRVLEDVALGLIFAHRWIKVTRSPKVICRDKSRMSTWTRALPSSSFRAVNICMLVRFDGRGWSNDWWHVKYDILPVGSFFERCASEVAGLLMTSSGFRAGLLPLCSPESPSTRCMAVNT